MDHLLVIAADIFARHRVGFATVQRGRWPDKRNAVWLADNLAPVIWMRLRTVGSLRVSPTESWRFVGWSGDVDCADGSVLMNANKSCTATFARYQVYLPLILK